MVQSLLELLRKAASDGDVEGFVAIKHELLREGYTIYGDKIADCDHDWKPIPDNQIYLRCKKCGALGHRDLRQNILPVICRKCNNLATRWIEGSPNCRKDH